MKIPEAITKRDMLHGAKKKSDKEIQELTRLFLEKEWISDAIDFSKKNPAALEKIRQKAAEEGDAFFLLKASRLVEEESIPTALLQTCAQNAEAQGKTRYAIMAHEKLGNSDKVQSLKDSIKDDGDIIAEKEEDVFIPEHADEIES